MNIQRGDVVKARFPHASGEPGKKRPVIVVQADSYNQRLRHAVVAEVTGNLEGKGDPACLFVDRSTTGLQRRVDPTFSFVRTLADLEQRFLIRLSPKTFGNSGDFPRTVSQTSELTILIRASLSGAE